MYVANHSDAFHERNRCVRGVDGGVIMSDELSPLRNGRITGSRLSGILGLSKFTTRAGVLREMVRQHLGLPEEFTGSEATEYGQLHESDAIAGYEQQTGVIVHSKQLFVIHPFYDFLAVTVDGYVDDDGMVEAKCPWRARYRHIDDKPEHLVQVLLQLEVTGRKWCDYAVWRPRKPVDISRVVFDQGWLPSVMPRLTEFMAEFAAAIVDPVIIARERGRGVAVEVSDRDKFLADVTRWRELRAMDEAVSTEITEVKERVSEQLGDNEIALADGVPTAKWQYRNGPSVFDRASFKKAHADLEAQYTSTGPSTRYPILIDEEGEPA